MTSVVQPQHVVSQPFSLGAVNQATPWMGPPDRGLAGDITIALHGIGALTVTFFGKLPDMANADRVAIQATNLNSGSAATTATANGLYRINAAGLQVQVEITAYTSGSVQVRGMPTVG